ncbi:MAG TPA: Gfo/Idh/MocA family oxidoreductase [Terriglobia bacterium]|nr:Gfo/Idh/MocA family oxidoreductase [Terriglobia bacterium]
MFKLMKNNRRGFIEKTGLMGLGVAGSGLFRGSASASDLETDTAAVSKRLEKSHVQRFNMSGFAAPALESVRIAIIGTGNRGPSYCDNMKHVEGAEIKALCDIRREKAEAAKARLAGTRHNPDIYTGPEDWKRVCERKDIDLVIITTPFYMHTPMAVYAMNHGKHVATAVPAAATIQECWELVETAERTRRHCKILENIAYGPFQLMTLNMARRGVFGEVVHGECAYNSSKMANNFSKTMYWDMWWLKQYASRRGNMYPTHGLGPISQVMNINRGDQFEFLVSVESKDYMMKAKAQELAATDDFFKPFAEKNYRGNMSVTIIRTRLGRTIMLEHDATDPTPESYIHGIYGTKGAARLDPPPARLALDQHAWLSPEEFKEMETKHTAEITRKVFDLALQLKSGHGGVDLLESWRLIDCLRNGLPLDMDVYDAAAWSCIVPLSQWSVLNRSNSIDVPDFTAGAWKTNKLNMDINLERGGNTRILV